MIQRSTWLHLRVPFSFFLLPMFLFALSLAGPQVQWGQAVLALIAWHLCIYPASNGYNSYYDRDEDSIGGLEKPPPVSRELWAVALGLDAVGILLGLLVSWPFALALFVYGLVSKAYSHPAVRLKKYPVLSLLAVAVFQGGFTLLASYHALTGAGLAQLLEARLLWPAGLASLMLLGSYPMTQVYQHAEDARRGDLTLSRWLGIRGTFLYTMTVFGAATAGFGMYYVHYYSWAAAGLFALALGPVLGFFLWWLARTWTDAAQANFRYTMRLNALSASCLNGFYVVFWAWFG
ncbi:MAG: UbiA family prenyltransferase [Bernardetiaceae bacterium]|jgi:1,4-dihydroxy-2-naphthoate octaprenyltransferase|nr:UbiA family prenyltransferase [Bernardetiaceae bacterium]